MNLSLLGASIFEGADVGALALLISLIVVSVLLGIAEIFAIVVRIILVVRYRKLNQVQTQVGYTAFAAARTFLDMNNLQDVRVEQCGFWRTLFFGNGYSVRKNTIFLRKNIINNSTITAIGLALQKVAIVIQDKKGNKITRIKNRIQAFIPFAPFLILPIILVGVIIDSLIFGMKGLPVGTLVSSIIAIVFYLAVIGFGIMVIKVEKKANNDALALMQQTNFLTEPERAEVKKVFDSYILSYIADLIVAILQVIKLILQLVWKSRVLAFKK